MDDVGLDLMKLNDVYHCDTEHLVIINNKHLIYIYRGFHRFGGGNPTGAQCGVNSANTCAISCKLSGGSCLDFVGYQASGSHPALSCVPYVFYGVKYIDLVSLAHFPGRPGQTTRRFRLQHRQQTWEMPNGKMLSQRGTVYLAVLCYNSWLSSVAQDSTRRNVHA